MLNILQKMKYITLNVAENLKMPIIGLGTWRSPPEETESVVLWALKNGYRHIDTAFNYNNEEAIGVALSKWLSSGEGKREDLFITTKLPMFGNRASDVEFYLKMSLKKLQLDYVDLYLIHTPFCFLCDKDTYAPAVNKYGRFLIDPTNDNEATWKVMEEQVNNGLAKAIGLSNFNADQTEQIYYSATLKPSVLQVELHAYLQQKELREVCKELKIAVTAYAPLGSPGAQNHFNSKYNYVTENFPDILGNPVVAELAPKYQKTRGQILLKHLVQEGVSVIPKSGNLQRIIDNINILDFEIACEDIEKLNALDQGECGRIFDFLFLKGVDKHPQYPFPRDPRSTF